jgi:ketosteroid isomerase-like protein
MTNPVLKGIWLAFATSMVFSCNPNADGDVMSQEEIKRIKEEIQAREDEFAQVYNSKEMKSIGYYADDAITYYQNRQPLVGKQAIVDFLGADLASNSNTISFSTTEVFPFHKGKQVLEIGYFKVLDSAGYVINSGNYMALFEKRNGVYVSIRDMSVSDRPLP